MQQSALQKSDLKLLQDAQMQCKVEVAQLSSAFDRQEGVLQDADMPSVKLRDELTDTRTEIHETLQSK